MAHADPGPILAAPAAPVQVYTLGRFQVLLDGAPMQFPARARRAPDLLKALVALGGESVPVETIAEALWPDADGDGAQSALTVTLHRLRAHLGRDALVLQNRRLSLDGTHCWLDTRAFAEALEHSHRALGANDPLGALGHLEQALTLYRGPFLDGEFEPTPILSARERLHGMFLRHLGTLADGLAANGNAERAIDLYRRGLELDPLAESFYQALMRIHLERGQAAEGIAIYRRCRDLLAGEFGVEPAAETERLHQALLDGNNRSEVRKPPAAPEPASTDLQKPPASGPTLTQNIARPWRLARRRVWSGIALGAAVAVLLTGMAVWQVSTWMERGDPPESRSASTLPEQPSLAVLAFANKSDDPEQEYLAAGLSDTLINRLAGVTQIYVIAAGSSLRFRSHAAEPREVGRKLGAEYLLEGSVWRQSGRMRLDVQLVNADSGTILWANRYEQQLQSVFAVMDDISMKVITELRIKLTVGESARLLAHATHSPEALEAHLRGKREFLRFEPSSNRASVSYYQKALEFDPRFASAIAMIGWTHIVEVLYGWTEERVEALQRGEEFATQALAADPDNNLALTLMSRVHVLRGRRAEGLATARQAVAVAPNDPTALGFLSHLLVWEGETEEALPLIRKALRLSPYPMIYLLNYAGDAYYFAGQFEEATRWYRKHVERQQRGEMARLSWQFLVASLIHLGRLDEARAEVARLLVAHPDFELGAAEHSLRKTPFKHHEFVEPLMSALRQAGLPAPTQLVGLHLPEAPSIIVLPLENLTGDASQDYLASGLSESLTTELYKLPGLFVIARRTAEYYGDKHLTAQQIAREVGVAYVLEGSVQRTEERLRVNVQLIKASTEGHVWAEQYDQVLGDLFRVQDEIIRKIALELGVRLSWGEILRLKSREPKNYRAWELYVRGDLLYSKGDTSKAREVLAEAMRADPSFTRPVAMMGWTHLVDYLFGRGPDPKRSLALAEEWAQRALAMDDQEVQAHTVMGRILVIQGHHEEGIARSRRALEIEPNNPVIMASLAFQYVYALRPREALPLLTRAFRLAPYPPEFFLSVAGVAYAMTGQHQEALILFRRFLARIHHGPAARRNRRWLVASLMEMGREAEARSEVQAWLAQDPTVTLRALEQQARRQPFRDHAFLAPQLALLRRAGIPD